MTASTSALPHPRIQERLEAVEGEQLRTRNRKLIAVGVLVLLALIAFGITRSPFLDIDEVRVIGASRSGPNALRAVAGIETGTPLLGLDLEQAERRLLALPDVAGVVSTRSWDGVVTIEVTERVPAARVQMPDGGAIIVSTDGMVIEVTDTPDMRLPQISGAMFSVPVGALAPMELADAIAVASALPSDIGRVTDRVQLSVDSLGLRLAGGGSVALGDARDLEAKFDAVRAFLAQVDLSCLEEIDVQAPTVPVLARSEACR